MGLEPATEMDWIENKKLQLSLHTSVVHPQASRGLSENRKASL